MVNFEARSIYEVGELVRSLGYHRGQQNPWYMARYSDVFFKKFEEGIVVGALDNTDGEWVNVLHLETSTTSWFSRWHFERALYA